jgi:hypothetical protein
MGRPSRQGVAWNYGALLVGEGDRGRGKDAVLLAETCDDVTELAQGRSSSSSSKQKFITISSSVTMT